MKLIRFCFLILAFCGCTSAHASVFGTKGQLIPGGSFSFTYNHESASAFSEVPLNLISAWLSAGGDYFFVDNLSIGGSATIGLSNFPSHCYPGNGLDFRFGFGPRVGLNIPINDSLDIYSRLASNIYFSYLVDDYHWGNNDNNTGFGLKGDIVYRVGFIVPLKESVSLEMGPSIRYEFADTFLRDGSSSLASTHRNDLWISLTVGLLWSWPEA